ALVPRSDPREVTAPAVPDAGTARTSLSLPGTRGPTRALASRRCAVASAAAGTIALTPRAPLAPRASPPCLAAGSALVLSTLFTTSVWRKYMPGRNAIGPCSSSHLGALRLLCSADEDLLTYIPLPAPNIPHVTPS